MEWGSARNPRSSRHARHPADPDRAADAPNRVPAATVGQRENRHRKLNSATEDQCAAACTEREIRQGKERQQANSMAATVNNAVRVAGYLEFLDRTRPP